MEPEIICTEINGRHGNIGQILLNRPKALNALSLEMCSTISNQLAKWAVNDAIKAVFIKGAGDKAFCAGGDIRQLYKQKDSHSPDELATFFREEYAMNARLFHFPKPFIAFLDGITMGGGVGVSIHGSHQIATEKFMFAMPETAIGFFPDIGASYYLSRCQYQIGTYLGLTGQTIHSADALACGFITHSIPRDKLNSIEKALLDTEFGSDPFATVTEILNSEQQSLSESKIWPKCKLIESYFTADSIQDVFERLHHSKESFAKEIVTILQKRSPTSLAVIMKQFHKAKAMHFDDIMKMDFDIAQHFLQNHDFFEGIRAVLIDKDQHPKWQPATIHEIDDAHINHYFQPINERLQLPEFMVKE